MLVEPALTASLSSDKTTSPPSTTPLKTATSVTYADFGTIQPSFGATPSTVAGSSLRSIANFSFAFSVRQVFLTLNTLLTNFDTV